MLRALASLRAGVLCTAGSLAERPLHPLKKGAAQMATQRVPDDIKIIAQFLAAQGAAGQAWEELTGEAFKLRRQLKQRGGFRLARSGGGPLQD